MCGASSFKILEKGSGMTNAMIKDFLKACSASSKATSKDGNERCTYITKFAKEKFGGTWQAVMLPCAPAEQRGGSIKWIEEKRLYIDCKRGGFQLWIWKTA